MEITNREIPVSPDLDLSNPAWAIDYVVLSGGIGPDSEWGGARAGRPWGSAGGEYDGVPHRLMWRGRLRFIRRLGAPTLHSLAEDANLEPAYLLEQFKGQLRQFCVLDSTRRGSTYWRQVWDTTPVA